jgi:DNA-binding LytR/AlgR family response regulator
MNANNSSHQLSIEVKTPDGFKIINCKNIIYIKAERKCSIVHLNTTDDVITYHLLKWYNQYLLTPYFFRCHNSYIVNCEFVDCFNHKTITLNDKNKIPLSRNRTRPFKDNLKFLKGLLFSAR